VITARFNPHNFFLSIFDGNEGMVHTHENVAAYTGLALELESEVATTNKGLQNRGNTKKVPPSGPIRVIVHGP